MQQRPIGPELQHRIDEAQLRSMRADVAYWRNECVKRDAQIAALSRQVAELQRDLAAMDA